MRQENSKKLGDFFASASKDLRAYLTKATLSSDDIEDLVQEAFANVAHQYQEGQAEALTRAYLFQVAKNLLVNQQKRHSVQKRNYAIAAHYQKRTSHFEDSLLNNMLIGDIDAFVRANFSQTDRAIFHRRHFENQTMDTIAAETGISKATVSRISERMTKSVASGYRDAMWA